jgi:quercetin dioxygenase-like cupin family protein
MPSASRLPVALAALLSLALVSAGQHADGKKGKVMVTPADMKWQDGPPSLPKGARMAVLEGDPSKEGPFVIRAKLPDGYRIAPHTHPRDERLTVLSGTLYFGMGDKFNEKAAKAMPAGSYARAPAGMTHFIWAKGETVLQVNGEGPFVIRYVNPADDPRTKK